MIKAVITGDIIHSTSMGVKYRSWLFKKMEETLKGLNKEFYMRSEIYRGDSFQCSPDKPSDALRVALLLKTFIRGLNPSEAYNLKKKHSPTEKRTVLKPTWIFDARIAIGIGEVDSPGKRLATSGGIAFQLSGHLLDELKNSKRALGIVTNDKFSEELEIEGTLLDAIISKTSALQCEVIYWKLMNYKETKIAKEIGIKQSAVNQRSIAGNWNAINAMINHFEKMHADE